MNYTAKLLLESAAGLLILLALLIRYQIGKRRFNRRSAFGLQQFPSYGCAVLTTLGENLLLFIAVAMAIAALILLLTAFIYKP